MKRVSNLYDSITQEVFNEAVDRACEKHMKKRVVIKYRNNLQENNKRLYKALLDGSYIKLLRYRDMVKRGNNGKLRHISQPSLETRIYQHLMLLVIIPLYDKKDPKIARNCKKGYGITTKKRNHSIRHEMKHTFYDRREYEYGIYFDERKSYEHCTKKAFTRGLKCLTDDKKMIDYCINVTFRDGKLPIGAPSSPPAHHISRLPSDLWLKHNIGVVLRYADDVFGACHTKEEGHQLLWRAKQFFWYELGVRLKHTARVFPLNTPFDFCGFIFHRNEGIQKNQHNKGYTKTRKDTIRRAHKRANDKSWGSYYGQMKDTDCWNEMREIEEEMKLRRLTDKIKITRDLDAPPIDIKQLEGKEFELKDYEMRKDSQGKVNWIKCLIAIKDGRRIVAREFHGNFKGIYTYLIEVEKHFSKEKFLPLEECVIVNQCGYIFKDSTKQITDFDE